MSFSRNRGQFRETCAKCRSGRNLLDSPVLTPHWRADRSRLRYGRRGSARKARRMSDCGGLSFWERRPLRRQPWLVASDRQICSRLASWGICARGHCRPTQHYAHGFAPTRVILGWRSIGMGEPLSRDEQLALDAFVDGTIIPVGRRHPGSARHLARTALLLAADVEVVERQAEIEERTVAQ